MPIRYYNKLTIRGPNEEINRFKNGVQIVDNRHCLLQSYLPCPQKLLDTRLSFDDIGYEVFFNPDPKGYLSMLELPGMKGHGIETREQLMEYTKRVYSDSYEKGLKINDNLFEFGCRTWREWCVVYWGTKCEVFGTQLKETSPTELIFEFHSAWSPPEIGIDQIAALFPELDFYLEFRDLMVYFLGFDHWVNGELIEHHFENPTDEDLEDGPDNPENITIESIEGGISAFAKAEPETSDVKRNL